MQVLELWEDKRPAAQAKAPAQRHVVRVLFNKDVVEPPVATAGEPLTLAALLDTVLQPLAVPPVEFELLCAAGKGAGEGGSMDTSSIS